MKNIIKYVVMLSALTLVIACSDSKQKTPPRGKAKVKNPIVQGPRQPITDKELETRYIELSEEFKSANKKLKAQIEANDDLKTQLQTANEKLEAQIKAHNQLVAKQSTGSEDLAGQIAAADEKIAAQVKANEELQTQLDAANEKLTTQVNANEELQGQVGVGEQTQIELKNMARDSNQLLLETSSLMKELDEHAVLVRTQYNKIHSELDDYRDSDEFKANMVDLDLKVQDALTVIAKIEMQTSEKNLQFITDDENKQLITDAVKALSGMRELFKSQYTSMVDLVNAKIENETLRLKLSEADIDVTCEGDHTPVEISPIVENIEDGGEVSGFIQYSEDQTQGLAGLILGLKKSMDSVDYIHTAQTDDMGTYRTPLLLPGTYYIDLVSEDNESDKAIKKENIEVVIRRGQRDFKNILIVEPEA